MDRFLKPAATKTSRAQSLLVPRPIIASALKSVDKGNSTMNFSFFVYVQLTVEMMTVEMIENLYL
jgi:hypothetical protein